MSVVFRAEDVPVANRVDYWQHVISDNLVPMDVWLDDEPGVRDELVTGAVGPIRFAQWSTGPGRTRRTAKHIRRSDDDLYQLFVAVDGRVVGEQDGVQNELAPHDIALVDPSRSLRCRHTAHRGVLVAFPRALTPLHRREVARLLGSRIPGDRGTGALVSTLVRELPRNLDDAQGTAAARIGTAVLDLLTVTLAARLDRNTTLPPDTRQRALLLRVHAFIEARLGDPALTPAAVAAAHHISLRYLHKLFESQGHTVAGLIRERRLDRCRRDLTDPALAARPVSATALRWGFVNAAHFSRLFRSAYGLPPAEFRLAHLAA